MTSSRSDRSAGSLAEWLVGMRAALTGNADSDVPCDGCTGCCRSGLYLEVGADETDALAHIPAAYIQRGPHPDDVHLVEPGDDGCCPMLHDGMCSIYEHRPRTCRTFDCRVFAATGVDADESMPLIAEQSRRWSFEPMDDTDRRAAVELRAVAEAPTARPASRLGRAVRIIERTSPTGVT